MPLEEPGQKNVLAESEDQLPTQETTTFDTELDHAFRHFTEKTNEIFKRHNIKNQITDEIIFLRSLLRSTPSTKLF